MSSTLFLVLSAPCRYMLRCFGGTETLEYSTSFAVVISSSQKCSATMRLIIDRGKTLIRFVQKHKSLLITTLSQVAMTLGDNTGLDGFLSWAIVRILSLWLRQR